MKRVLLFFPSSKFGGAVQERDQVPLSLLTIATPLDRAGYKVRIIDQRVDKNWKESFLQELKEGPICVGISSMTGPQIANALVASQLAKRHGDVPVVWGGIHPTLLPDQTLESEAVDIVVQGEGEETFFELVQAIEDGGSLHKVRGIYYKEGNQTRSTPPRPLIDLNQQPPLSYHLVEISDYPFGMFEQGNLTFETSRGCPLRCGFCYNTRVYKSTWRGLTADETIRRTKILINDHGIRGISFADDNFFGNRERGIQILRRIKEEKLGVTISKLDAHFSVLSKLTDEELTLIRESGARILMIGVESGSPRILGMMKKRLEIQEILDFNKRVMKFDLMPLYFFMVGFPTETLEELSQTVSLMMRILQENPRAVAHMNIFTPFPGTELFDISRENGLRMPERLEEWVPFNYRTLNPNTPWLSERRRKIIRMLDFTAMIIDRNNFISPYKKTKPLIRLLARLYYPVAKMRMKRLYYRFFIERRIAEWLGLFPKQESG
jgi:radical SAM superfamily enzyme YgiQ (UPF0313 family)